jgi:hypothetical protein
MDGGAREIYKMKTIAMAVIAIMALTSVAHAQYNEFGPDAGNTWMTGGNNTANGFWAFYSNETGFDNTANGAFTLFYNTTGGLNTANGESALFSNTTGNANTANGAQALLYNTTGRFNTAAGFNALFSNTTGDGNTANGFNALYSNTTGSSNIALGFRSGSSLTNGDNNIYIGNSGMTDESSTIRIGTPGMHTNTFIAGISGVTVPNAANPVVVDSVSGQLGTVDIGSLKGADGTNGVDGIGFVPGAYLYLPSTTAAPTGFTKIGTKSDLITDLHGHLKTLKMNVYQKN